MKLLIFGHWTETGFGVVTQRLAERFVKQGADVRVIASNYRGEPLTGLMNGRVWHAGIYGDKSGGNISHEAALGLLWQHYRRGDTWTPDAALFIADTGSLTQYLGKPRLADSDSIGPFGRALPAYVYTPIEGDRLPDMWRKIWKFVKPIAMSEFGQWIITQHMMEPVPMFYHGVDTQVFHKATKKDPIIPEEGGGTLKITSKEEAKRAAGLNPERRYILRADRLTERKHYWALIESMRVVFQVVPDVDLILHCAPIDDGLNLHSEIGRLPEALQERCILTGAHDTWMGLSPSGLAGIYNASDLYVSPTGGEGFGLTLAEAVACGTPVITTGYAAGVEVVGPGGWLVPPLLDHRGNEVRYVSRYGMDWRMPDVEAFTSTIITALNTPPETIDNMMTLGREHIMKSFSWNVTAKGMLQHIENGVKEWHGSHPDSSRSQDVPSDRLDGHEARRAIAAVDSRSGSEPGAPERTHDLVLK